MNNTKKALIVLATLGLLVSIYLTFKTYDPSSVSCSVGGGCETVLSSDYAKIFGIPVAIFGIAWYLAQLAILFLIVVKNKALNNQLEVWTMLGLLFSLPLLYLEAFVIHAYCTWCLVSLGIVTISTVLVFWPKLKRSN